MKIRKRTTTMKVRQLCGHFLAIQICIQNYDESQSKEGKRSKKVLLGDPEVTANLYCNFACPYWEGCVIFSIYLRSLLGHPVGREDSKILFDFLWYYLETN